MQHHAEPLGQQAWLPLRLARAHIWLTALASPRRIGSARLAMQARRAGP